MLPIEFAGFSFALLENVSGSRELIKRCSFHLQNGNFPGMSRNECVGIETSGGWMALPAI